MRIQKITSIKINDLAIILEMLSKKNMRLKNDILENENTEMEEKLSLSKNELYVKQKTILNLELALNEMRFNFQSEYWIFFHLKK
jgi:hypothetical protein